MTLGRTLLHLLVYALTAAPVVYVGARLIERPQRTSLLSSAAPQASSQEPLASPDLAVFLDDLAAGESPHWALESLLEKQPPKTVEEPARLVAAELLADAQDLEGARAVLVEPPQTSPVLRRVALELMARLERPASPERALALAELALSDPVASRAQIEALRLKGELLVECGQVDRGLEVLEAAEAGFAGSRAGALLGLSRLRGLEASGRETEAENARLALIVDYPLMTRDDELGPVWRELEKSAAPFIVKAAPEARLRRAEALFAAGRISDAQAIYKTLKPSDPDERQLVELRLGQCAYRRRQYRDAVRLLRQADPPPGLEREASYYLAEAELRAGSSETYDRLLEELAQSGDPEWGLKAGLSLVDTYRQRKLTARSDQLLERLLALYPGSSLDDRAWQAAWQAWLDGDRAEASRRFEAIRDAFPDSVWAMAARYWLARAGERAGELERAASGYAELAGLHPGGFYGLAANRRLAALAAAEPQLEPYREQAQAAIEAWARLAPDPPPAGAHSELARQLNALRLHSQALREVEFQLELRPDDRLLKAQLAESYHGLGDFMASVRWLQRAFPDASRAGIPQAYHRLLYPLRDWDVIAREAEARNIDPYFVAALIHQESRFQDDARSQADARGLMQIMPRTGKEIARQLGEPAFETARLYDPELNVRFGTHYISNLLDDFGGREELALASYNAGKGRVQKWLKERQYEDSDEFVESIPFRETRIYVKNIIVGHYQYQRLYSPTAPMFAARD